MSDKKYGYSPKSYTGINYFDHFLQQRLQPYGKIKEHMPDSVMLGKANALNCEYVVRPAVLIQ